MQLAASVPLRSALPVRSAALPKGLSLSQQRFAGTSVSYRPRSQINTPFQTRWRCNSAAGVGGPPAGGSGGSGPGDKNDGSGQDEGPHGMQKWTYLYALFLGGGAGYGYYKKQSTASLGFGGSAALMMCFVAYQMRGATALNALRVGFAVTGALTAALGLRFSNTGKFFPAGLVALVSAVLWYGYMDGTLANQKSSARFPTSEDDWKLYNKKVPAVMKELSDEGYKIVILSNQNGIKSKLDGPASKMQKGRFQGVIDKLGVPVQAFMATLDDDFRKPQTGMWNFMLENCNDGVKVDLKRSFFCGDAARRPLDFSDSDKKLAENIGLPFKVPEDVFGEMEGKRKMAAPAKPAAGADAPAGPGANDEIADIFARLETYHANRGKDGMWAMIAARKARAAISSYPIKITQSNIKEAGKLQGVGKGSIAVIQEYLTTGKVKMLEAPEEPVAPAGGTSGTAQASGSAAPAAKKAKATDAFNFM